MFNFLKKIFDTKEEKCCCDCCKADFIPVANKVYTRCGCNVIVPIDVARELDNNHYCISVSKYKGKPSCVQMFKTIDGKCKYTGTLKAYMNVKNFKDGNVCNFDFTNIIENEESDD